MSKTTKPTKATTTPKKTTTKIRAEFYNNLIDRILDSKLEAETRLEEELVEKIFFAINTVVERQGGFDDN